jgi:RNA polymerase sigma-70 factor, ECF subfamily
MAIMTMHRQTEFAQLTGPYRAQLLVHCYRMLGSVHDAEDLVQETYLRAWRSYDAFQGRASMRTYLYRIATNACLTALEQRSRRPMPSGLTRPNTRSDPEWPDAARPVDWLQPIPDALLGSYLVRQPDEPAGIVDARAGVRLAFVAALQHLSPRRRAVLILCDVLSWRAAEVATMLGTTSAAVSSALLRARAQLAKAAPALDEIAEPAEPHRRALLDRYVTAFHKADVTELLQVLRADIALEMPPLPQWFQGRSPVGAFFATHVLREPGAFRMVETSANGQPAFAAYHREPGGSYRAHAVHVLALADDGVAHIAVFHDPRLFQLFGLADTAHRVDPHHTWPPDAG